VTADRTFTLERRSAGTATIFYLDGPLRLGHREATTGQQLSDAVRRLFCIVDTEEEALAALGNS
jgi:hypothetical protein